MEDIIYSKHPTIKIIDKRYSIMDLGDCILNGFEIMEYRQDCVVLGR